MSASQDGSESVDQFLARIASVREGRDQASEDRTRRKEEDFLKSRKERQARRLERARSLSPSKTGPSTSGPMPQSSTSTRDTVLNPPVDFSPRSSTLSRSNAVSARTSPKLAPKQPDSDPFSPSQDDNLALSSSSGLARSGTLSWQQRPLRDGVANKPRPFSTIETIRTVPKIIDDHTEDKSEPTRQEIAASLGTKDPSWFRQTQERGLGSAAFRKNQVEDTNTAEHTPRSQGLPGMSISTSKSADTTPRGDDDLTQSVQESQALPTLSNRLRREVSPSPAGLANLPKLDLSPQQPPRLEPQVDVGSSNLGSSGSTLTGRPASPTKGLGGFVESAMMKRSDSVSKRWSVQANAGLKRGDSTAGMRPLSGVRSMHASSLSRNSNRAGSPSPMVISRPESREGTIDPKSESQTPDKRVKESESFDVSDKVPAVDTTARPQTPPEEPLSRSPSKTLDPRRWSPTKSSWLESALLSKPDPPRPQEAKEDVPAWKISLQRNKASRDLSPDKNRLTESVSVEPPPSNIKKSVQPPPTAKKPDVKHDDTARPAQVESKALAKVDETHVITDAHTSTNDLISRVETNVTVPNKEQPADETSEQPNRDTSQDISEEKLDKKPPVLKPKPRTPPKTDFRSNLRSRAPASLEENASQPEFKSIFGKLKPTQTQNYVAPDTLKTNILTGKAALNVTSGPQKSQRVDEFKESILHKKEAMKADAILKKETTTTEIQTRKPEPTIPEALARRKTLSKATPPVIKLQNSSASPQSTMRDQLKPVVTTKPTSLAFQPPVKSSVISTEPMMTSSFTDAQKEPDRNLNDQKSTSLKQAVPVLPLKSRETTSRISPVENLPTSTSASTSAPMEAKSELLANSKLASRLNPNLATFLSRGGSPQPSASKSTSPERLNKEVSTKLTTDSVQDDPTKAGELTHMTKGRAKGPKRRAPKSQGPQAAPLTEASVSESVSQVSKPREPPQKSFSVTPMKTPRDTWAKPEVTPTRNATYPPIVKKDLEKTPDKMQVIDASTKPKPVVASKSPELRRVSSNVVSQHVDVPPTKASNTGDFEIAADVDNLKTSTIPSKPVPRPLPVTPKTVSTVSPLTPSKSRVNTPKVSPSATNLPFKPLNPKPTTGLGLSVKSAPVKPTITPSELTPPPDRPTKSSTTVQSQLGGLQSSHVKTTLSAYFSLLPDRQQKSEFDTQQLLTQSDGMPPKTRTISHNIWEITGGGRKSTMPSQQEHILYEDNMYLLTHIFETEAGGRSSEVYLWCGDDVGDAAIEDAQLFCRKEAREHNTKLEVLRQGKETSRFFQALGGILIVRRTKSTSLYMLRGRRHLGHVAFDEIDLAASNLCSGFPHLISAKSGKLYLWKGKGSGADEVGCARLIGMDLGEIEEVDEGKETAAFWDAFGQQTSRYEKWSDDWKSRAEHDGYPSVLYRIDMERPKSGGGFWGLRSASPPKTSNKLAAEPITPFCHRDIEATYIYVLDAYRSIYVIINPQAANKSTEVVTAFYLAQELAMLSPSIQDRSILPNCYVAFGDPPSDVKVCFRKWSEGRPNKSDKPSACLKLEDVMDALKL